MDTRISAVPHTRLSIPAADRLGCNQRVGEIACDRYPHSVREPDTLACPMMTLTMNRSAGKGTFENLPWTAGGRVTAVIFRRPDRLRLGGIVSVRHREWSYRRTGRLPGLTLVELLATIAIVALLIGLLLPAVQSTRERARRIDCGNRLRQIGLGLEHHVVTNGRLPAAGVSINPLTTHFNRKDDDSNPNNSMVWAGASWAVFLLPFVEQNALYDRYDHSLPAVSVNSTRVTSRNIDLFDCPSHPYVRPGATSRLRRPSYMFSHPRPGLSYPTPLPSASGFIGFEKGNYAVNVGANTIQVSPGFSRYNASLRGPFSTGELYGAPPGAMHDGASTVILASEVVNVLIEGERDQRGAWGWPGGSTFCGRGRLSDVVLTPNTLSWPDEAGYVNHDFNNPIFHFRSGFAIGWNGGIAARSFHTGGCNFLFADGSLRLLSDSIDRVTYLRLLSMADGKIVGAF
jgi:prepilin-type processing-associated H-X9-DG protein